MNNNINSGYTTYDKRGDRECLSPYNVILGRDTALPSPNFGY